MNGGLDLALRIYLKRVIVENFRSVTYKFTISVSTISPFIIEVCKEICDVRQQESQKIIENICLSNINR